MPGPYVYPATTVLHPKTGDTWIVQPRADGGVNVWRNTTGDPSIVPPDLAAEKNGDGFTIKDVISALRPA